MDLSYESFIAECGQLETHINKEYQRITRKYQGDKKYPHFAMDINTYTSEKADSVLESKIIVGIVSC